MSENLITKETLPVAQWINHSFVQLEGRFLKERISCQHLAPFSKWTGSMCWGDRGSMDRALNGQSQIYPNGSTILQDEN